MRGAWIEIDGGDGLCLGLVSLPMRGAWIEIGYMAAQQAKNLEGRSPCGERGLKYYLILVARIRAEVAPHAGSVD